MTKISGPSSPATPAPVSFDDDEDAPLEAPQPQAPDPQVSAWTPMASPRPSRVDDLAPGIATGAGGPGAAAGAPAGAAVAPVRVDTTTIPGAINAMATSPGYKELSAADQSALSRRVTNNSPMGQSARWALNTVMNAPGFSASTKEAQAAALKKFVTDETGTPDVVAQNATEPTTLPAYTISPPVAEAAHQFDAGKADAQHYTVAVNGHNVDVYMANTSTTPNHHSIEQVAKGLAALPAQSLALVKSVSVNPDFNPADAHWAQVYHRPDFHSYMTAGSAGDVNIYPTTTPQGQAGMDVSMIHETGHVLSKRQFGENSTQGEKWKAWNDAAAADGMHPSQYAKSSGDEDFAESLALYQQAKGTPQEAELRKLFPARFAILDGMTK